MKGIQQSSVLIFMSILIEVTVVVISANLGSVNKFMAGEDVVCAITWHPPIIINFFQKSSYLKPLHQFEPKLYYIFLRMPAVKIVSNDSANHPTWLLLSIE